MNTLRKIFRYWDSVLALVAGIASAAWLSASTIKDITPELMAFFTIQSAVILPAMIFSAGLLRGDGLTLREVDLYQTALRRQMRFWVTLLFLDLIAAAILVLGKAADWTWKITIYGHHTGQFGWVMIGATAFFSTLAILRMIPFVRGVMSQLELNGTLARKLVESRERERALTQEPPEAPFDRPQDFGRVVGPRVRRRG
jgi:hypothetical protein